MVRFVRILVNLMSYRIMYRLGISHLISYTIRIVFSCQVSPNLRVGKNLTLAYGGLGTVVHGSCIIGDNVTIGTNVTLGGNFGKGGVPKIDDNVYIATGAKVFGPVTIGKNAIIGANAVVITDVKSNSLYGGIPAQKLKSL